MAVGRSDRILVNGYNLSSAMNKIEVKSTREKLDATTLADANRVYESGFRTGTASTEGFFDSDTVNADKITDIIAAAFESGTQEVVTLGYGLYASGGPVYVFDGCVANWDLPIVVNQIILTNANWTSNNGMMRGRWLVSSQLNAGTNTGTAVNNLAASTNGGLSHVHIENTDATGVSVLTQQSTDNSNWTTVSEAVFGTRATGGYTFGVNPSNTNTIIFNGVTFTFVNTASTSTNINIKGTLALTMAEAAVVLNASVNASINIATYTATATGINVSYIQPGTVGNAYTLGTPTAGNVTRTGAALSGGLNLVAAVHDKYSETIAAGTTVARYLRTITKVYGGSTVLVSAAFARG